MTIKSNKQNFETSDVKDSAQVFRPLRIGIMLRGINEIDGPGVYIRALCAALVKLFTEDKFVFFYMNTEQAGRFKEHSNVEEVVIKSPGDSKLFWDQFRVPIAAKRKSVDVLFHHKFSIPLIAPCPTIVQQRGAEYWTFSKWYDTTEKLYSKISIPIYCKKADAVLTVSDSLAHELAPYVGLPPEEFHTIYSAPSDFFQPISDQRSLNNIRKKYKLPYKEFFLMVAKGYSRVDSTTESIYPRKNVIGTLEAYQELQKRIDDPPPLVVAGPGFNSDSVEHFKKALIQPDKLFFPGFVEHKDMPEVYSMAKALVFPSYSEAFANPLLEAMACGCPIITSNIPPCTEAVGDAALTVDPGNSDEILLQMERLSADQGLLQKLQNSSLNRVKEFTWEKSAIKLRKIIDSVV